MFNTKLLRSWLNINKNERSNWKTKQGIKDPEYKQGWIANIAMAQLDNERWYREKHNKVGKYLNYKDRHAIANLGAEYFLKLLSM
jgi:hypothetical protein